MKVIAIKPLLFLVAVLVMINLVACLGLNVTPEPVPPTATQLPQPTETQPPAAQEFFTEEFDNNINNWKQTVKVNASSKGDLSQANIYVKDGYLVFDLGKWLLGYVLYEPFSYSNVRIDVSVENRGTNLNNILLFCRVSNEGHYLVRFASSGLYTIYAFDGAKNNYTEIADGGSNKIRAGKEVNEYSLVCIDNSLIVYVNGEETRTYTDGQYIFRDGMVGVGAASEDLLPVELEFDWVKISQP